MHSNRELSILNKISNFNPGCKIYAFEPIESTYQKLIAEAVRRDNFMRENKIDSIDFFQLDIEGAEYEVLVGFEYNITNGEIRGIRFEYNYINIPTRKFLIDCHNFFESNDFIMVKIVPKIAEFGKHEFNYLDFLIPNFIMARKPETELIALLCKK